MAESSPTSRGSSKYNFLLSSKNAFSTTVAPIANDGHDSQPVLLPRQLRLVHRLPLHVKNHIVAVLSEFVGTFLFLLLAFGGTNAVNTPAASRDGDISDPSALPAAANDPARLLFIGLCFGMSLSVNAWVFFRISGGLFNPAVSLAMVVVGAMDWVRGALVVTSQLLGGIAAAGVVRVVLPGPLNVQTALGGGASVAQGLFIEMFLTAQLIFTIFMLAAEKHRATFIAPVGIGLSLFVAEMMGVYYTGGSLNPARSFGPSVVLGTFYDYHWIYWIGPVLGALLASGFYVLVKGLEYETVNPGQDHAGDGDAGGAVVSSRPELVGLVPPPRSISRGVGSDGPYVGGPSLETGRETPV